VSDPVAYAVIIIDEALGRPSRSLKAVVVSRRSPRDLVEQLAETYGERVALRAVLPETMLYTNRGKVFLGVDDDRYVQPSRIAEIRPRTARVARRGRTT